MDILIEALSREIKDADEESFLLFSQRIPSHNLGFIDPKAQTIDLTLAGKDISIRQSPGLLSSNRKEGTTGAVLWKITPLFADWIASPDNLLARCGVVSKGAHVLELGCGVSGLVSLVLAPSIAKYVNTDQEYVLKYVRENVEANCSSFSAAGNTNAACKTSRKRNANLRTTSKAKAADEDAIGNILIRQLDWETTSLSTLYKDLDIPCLDLLISCDCIYNESLIEPLVSTMRDICKQALASEANNTKTVCVVAQQLRSPDVFDNWLRRFCEFFTVWRVPDEELLQGLGEGSGYVVHIGILK